MKQPTKTQFRTPTILGLLLGLAFLTGCANASDSYDESYAAPEYAPEADYSVAEDAGGAYESAPAFDPERMIARNAFLLLVVDDVAQVAAKARTAVADLGGTVLQESLSLPDAEGSQSRAVIEVAVAPKDLEKTLDALSQLGEVNERRIDSIDVTDEVVDVDSRVATMRESIKRLQDLMAESGSVTEIASVESELTRRQAELESLLARQQSLTRRVEVSPITIEMATKVEDLQFRSTGFMAGLRSGWDALVSSSGVVLTVIGALLPWLAAAAIIGLPTLWLVRRWRRSRPKKPKATPARPAVMPQMMQFGYGVPPGTPMPTQQPVPPQPAGGPASNDPNLAGLPPQAGGQASNQPPAEPQVPGGAPS